MKENVKQWMIRPISFLQHWLLESDTFFLYILEMILYYSKDQGDVVEQIAESNPRLGTKNEGADEATWSNHVASPVTFSSKRRSRQKSPMPKKKKNKSVCLYCLFDFEASSSLKEKQVNERC